MMLRHSIKSVIRTPRKTALFLFLLIALTSFVIIGAGMYDSARNMLQDADQTFTTIAQLDYLGDIQGDEVNFYKGMNSDLSDFKFDQISKHPSVMAVNKEKAAWAYIEGEPIKRQYSLLYDYAIVKVNNIAPNNDFEYSGIVSEGLFGKRVRENAYILINGLDEMSMPLKLEFDQSHEYLLLGPVTKRWSPMLLFSIQSLEFARDIPNIVDLTKNPNYLSTEDGLKIIKLQDAMTVVDNSYEVSMVSSLEASSPYYFNEILMKEGRIFNSIEYEEGKSVILLSEAMADFYKVGVGDSLPLKLHYNSNGLGLSHYLTDNLYDYEDEYEVVGIFKNKEDNKHIIYMPEADWLMQEMHSTTIARYKLKNGSDEKFIQDNEKYLLSNMEFTIYDQGYKEAVKPIIAMKNSAIMIILLGSLSGVAILVLFSYLYIVKQRDTLRTMLSLGTSKSKVVSYILYGSLALVFISSFAGSLLTFGIINWITQWLFESMLETYGTDLRYSERALGLQRSFIPQVKFSPWLPVIAILAILSVSLCILTLITYTILRDDKLSSIASKTTKKVKIRIPSKMKTKRIMFARVRPTTLKFALISLTRNPGRSLIIPVLSAILSSFIIFLGLLSSLQEDKLSKVYDQIPVHVYIASYRDETRDIGGLNLTYDIYRMLDPMYSYRMEWNRGMDEERRVKVNYSSQDAHKERDMLLKESEYISQMQLYSAVKYEYMGVAITKEGIEDSQLSSVPNVRGHNNAFGYDWFLDSMKRMPTLAYADDIRFTPDFFKDTELNIEFVEGYHIDSLQQGEEIGMISRSFADKNEVSLGDTIRITAWLNNEERAFCSVIDLKVVGIYEKTWTTDTIYMPWIASYNHNYYLDYGYLSPNLEEFELWNETIPRSIRAATFTMRSTKGLSEFKDYLEDRGYSQVGRFSSNRRVIVIQDKQLVETVQSLKNHIRLIDTIKPIMLVLFGLIGFGASYLLIKHRVNELAIMRSMGARKHQVFLSYFMEQLLLFSIGLLPVMAYALLQPEKIVLYGISLVYFILSYFMGSALSLAIMNRVKILEILFEKE